MTGNYLRNERISSLFFFFFLLVYPFFTFLEKIFVNLRCAKSVRIT